MLYSFPTLKREKMGCSYAVESEPVSHHRSNERPNFQRGIQRQNNHHPYIRVGQRGAGINVERLSGYSSRPWRSDFLQSTFTTLGRSIARNQSIEIKSMRIKGMKHEVGTAVEKSNYINCFQHLEKESEWAGTRLDEVFGVHEN